MTTYSILHLFAGLGGAAMGFQQSLSTHKGVHGRFRTLAGIDVDPAGCRDFERLTGSPAACMDLFSREDYTAFHGKEPPETWREVTPSDLRAATGGECPDVVFLSPPCKGFSGLLPKKSAASEKYQALNRLTVRGLWYTLEAYADNLPGVIMLENVPRIVTRGQELLRQVRGMLEAYGYVHTAESHDCGEIGGLGQRRKRFLLIARLPSKVPAFVYRPPKLPLKTIGDIIGPMPMPDAPECGPIHRLPRLKWATWLRLALIPAGGDWRDLQKIAPENYRLTYEPRGGGTYGVQSWDDPAATVTGSASVKGSNAVAISDKRARAGHLRVLKFTEPSNTVVGAGRVGTSNGATIVADPRTKTDKGCSKNRHYAQLRVRGFDATAGTVTGAAHVGGGAPSIADPRLEKFGGSPGLYGVNDWSKPAPCVTGGAKVTSSNCAAAIADPRIVGGDNTQRGRLGVMKWERPSMTVTGSKGVNYNNGCSAISDPRLTPASPKFNHAYAVGPFDEPSPTVAGGTSPSSGGVCVADPRPRNGVSGVQSWEQPSVTVSGALDIHSGAGSVADPRLPEADERPDPAPVIIALDGTWHRPLTTLELAALQGFPLTMPDGSPLALDGKNDGRWRARIGNAVPPSAAKAMGEQILQALMAGKEAGFTLSASSIWVAPKVEELPA